MLYLRVLTFWINNQLPVIKAAEIQGVQLEQIKTRAKGVQKRRGKEKSITVNLIKSQISTKGRESSTTDNTVAQ
jgi:hypothetical protein